MIRVLFGILVLSACARPKPATFYEPEPASPGEAPADSETTSESTTTTESQTSQAQTTAEQAATTQAPPPKGPRSKPVPGTAAYCLYVGPERSVVRCYWDQKTCDEQIAFNKDYGVDKVQVCNGVAEAHCLVSDKSERCYPTAEDCADNVAGIRKQKRQTTDCVAKKSP